MIEGGGRQLSCAIVGNPESVANIWNEVQPLLQRAMAKSEGEQTEAEIFAELLANQTQLWVGMELDRVVAMWTTRIRKFGGKTICYGNYAAAEPGFLDELLRWFEQVCDWAEDNGCDQVQIIGRKGWQKKLDWRAEQLVYVKDLHGDSV